MGVAVNQLIHRDSRVHISRFVFYTSCRLPISRWCAVLVLQIGSNDLCDQRCSVHRFIWMLCEYIDVTVRRYDLIVMKILRRKLFLQYHTNTSIEQYNAEVDACNSELQMLLNAIYWNHGRRVQFHKTNLHWRCSPEHSWYKAVLVQRQSCRLVGHAAMSLTCVYFQEKNKIS